MPEIGLFLASEEHGPNELLAQAQMAESAGFGSIVLSDHFHPWTDRQGESSFVWSVIGGIAATTNLKVTTGVTCPIQRIHPVILAQAAATAQLLLGGRFVFGVGSGEALNEHITGQQWPPVAIRHEMLEEAVAIFRMMFGGTNVTHHGSHYTIENARLYSCPDEPPPVVISAFGPDAVDVAAQIGDGLMTVEADGDAVNRYRRQGGKGPAIGLMKVCWDNDEQRARTLAHDLWPTEALPGQLNQELAMPSFFEQAASLVTEDMVADKIPCGPDPERHLKAITSYIGAGFDQIYINQVGDDLAGFLKFYEAELRPRLGA
jgi:G6PDH family F420-dependent oxidoreductase